MVEINHDEHGNEVWWLGFYITGREKPYIKEYQNFGERFREIENLELIWQHKSPKGKPTNSTKVAKAVEERKEGAA